MLLSVKKANEAERLSSSRSNFLGTNGTPSQPLVGLCIFTSEIVTKIDLMSAIFTAASVTAKITRPVEAEGLDGVTVTLGVAGVVFGGSFAFVATSVLVAFSDSWFDSKTLGVSGRPRKDRPSKTITMAAKPPIMRFLFMEIL